MAFRVIRHTSEIPPDFGPCALTIGNFDGVHMGHRELMRRVVANSRKRSALRPSVLTFDPHPAKLLAPDRSPHLLTTLEQRLALIQSEQIEQVFVLPFNAAIAALTAEEFVQHLIVDKLKARYVAVGDNFRFGAKQTGDADLLAALGERHGFRAEAVAPVQYRGVVVSSSEIRRRIAAGDMGPANRMLQRPYGVEGRVVSGHGVGSKQTVPTLNLETAAEVLPATGVYITQTWDLGGIRKWNSISNIGYRPTFDGNSLSIETYLLSPFDGDTPAEIRVEFLQWVREERKFASPELLRLQIRRDVMRAESFFARQERM